MVFLPVVNGLTKVMRGIHYIDYKNIPQLNNTPCCTILKSGKEKENLVMLSVC